MAGQLKEVRNRIKSVQSTQQITKAMKMISAAKLRRAQERAISSRPYASMLALMVSPEEACRNMQRLSESGFEGKYGLYEAIDYTPSRLPRGQSFAVIQSFMAHHQGMNLVALSQALLGNPMQKRFAADPLTVQNLIDFGSLSAKTAEFLDACVRGRLNVTRHATSDVISSWRSERRSRSAPACPRPARSTSRWQSDCR